jgi:outer membrane protein assembly factor BamB
VAFDLLSGKLAWKGELSDYPWDSSGFGAYSIQSAYGMIFRDAYSGVYAIDWETGKIVWKYEALADSPYEAPYTGTNGSTVYCFNSGGKIADGKMYISNSEHSATYPLTRGWSLHCINITTGEGIWKIQHPMSSGVIADGYMTATDSYTGTMYVFGKGKSATTVTAPDVVMPLGNGVVIKGTVLDLSPAQLGTPCVSKQSMALQMEYLHLQMSQSGLWQNETVTGVPVTLTAIGSDGTVIDIGTVTTNGYYGTFSAVWTPAKEDKYEIIASFAGSESYGSSAASTALAIGPATKEIVIPEQVMPPDYTMTILGVGIAIMIVVVIAVAVAVLILRKR